MNNRKITIRYTSMGTVRGSNPGGGEIFRSRPDRPWGPPSLLYNGYRVSFPGVKRPGRGVDHPPSSSARVKERVELYLYSPSGPSWPVLGRILPLPYLLATLETFLFCTLKVTGTACQRVEIQQKPTQWCLHEVFIGTEIYSQLRQQWLNMCLLEFRNTLLRRYVNKRGLSTILRRATDTDFRSEFHWIWRL
jgi:hypothetical protein